MLICGNNSRMMHIYPDTPMFLADATSVAEALPCRHSVAVNRRTGAVPALAGRYAS
jgi:hypothetical protein